MSCVDANLSTHKIKKLVILREEKMFSKKCSSIGLALLLVGCAGVKKPPVQQSVIKPPSQPGVFPCTDEEGIRAAGLEVNFWMAEVLAVPGEYASFTCMISKQRIPDSFFQEQKAELLQVVFCRRAQDCDVLK